MSIRSTLLAVSALLLSANAHIEMASPVPYSVDKLDNAPITAAQYPCKIQNGFTVSKMNSMAVGQKQQIEFKGTAVHGGGSCQLSVTTDTEPNAQSVFKVIKTIEGGCPGLDGATKKFDFELPASIPNGKATFAWTWFAKLSGGPEMYMNCAPIDVTGGASDKSQFDALPDMLVANIASTDCKSAPSKAMKIPNPGSVVENGGDNDLVPPTGNCGKTGTSPPPPAGSSAPSAAPSAPAPSAPAPSAPAPVPSNTVPSAAPSPPANTGIVGVPGAPASTLTTLLTVTATPSAVAPSIPAGTGSPAPTGAPAAPGGGSGACTTDGAIVCNGANQFGICNFGKVVYQPVAAGTTCTDGKISKRGYNGRIARPRV